MKIFLEFEYVRNEYKEHGFYEFKILSCCAPTNLWLVVDNGINEDANVSTHDFQYKKIISLMEVSTRLQAGIELHGKVATIACGNYAHLYNIVLGFDGDSSDWEWKQHDNIISNGNNEIEIYLIDLDELHQSKEYSDLSLEDCIKKLLIEDEISYDLRTLKSIDKNGKILNVLEREQL